uniref:Putative secreted protein n=1 Tax=Anopheles darlingi TaxID=43151 RepID=A0A2M4D9X1_ANODA
MLTMMLGVAAAAPAHTPSTQTLLLLVTTTAAAIVCVAPAPAAIRCLHSVIDTHHHRRWMCSFSRGLAFLHVRLPRWAERCFRVTVPPRPNHLLHSGTTVERRSVAVGSDVLLEPYPQPCSDQPAAAAAVAGEGADEWSGTLAYVLSSRSAGGQPSNSRQSGSGCTVVSPRSHHRFGTDAESVDADVQPSGNTQLALADSW